MQGDIYKAATGGGVASKATPSLFNNAAQLVSIAAGTYVRSYVRAYLGWQFNIA